VDPASGGGRGYGAQGDQRRIGRDPGVAPEESRAGADHRNSQGGGGFFRAGARPATALVCRFIDEEKEKSGVAPVCRAPGVHGMEIAPRTYWAHRAAMPGKRELRDTAVTEILAGMYEPDANGRRPPESLYRTVKMRAHLNRQGIAVARCTVERLKRAHGWRGVTRGRRVRTTIADPAASRAPDLVRRQFKASRPGQRHLADFTYVPLAGGRFAYTAFVIDAFAGLIPGWECALPKQAAFAESAIRQAAAYRARREPGHRRCHSSFGCGKPVYERSPHRNADARWPDAIDRNRRRRAR
jgi:putative transposase